jgi:glycosyltransferase involved in cell wall biosynthesis
MQDKILVVSNMYPSTKYPHYGSFVVNCVEILKQDGYLVDVVSLKKTDNFFLKIGCYLFFYLEIIFKGLFLKYKCIFGHYASHIALPLLIVHLFRRTTIVVNVHGNDVVPEDIKDEKLLRYSKKLLNVASHVICPSEYFRDIVASFGISKDKITVYPSGGIDKTVFYPMQKEEACRYLNLSSNIRYIGYISRIEEKKGWDLFLKACNQVIKENTNCRLIIVGGGSQETEYTKLVQELNLQNQIIYFPLLSQEKLRFIFNVIDVFVFPTYRKSESLGLVGLEAMACGTLTILPDKYGPKSYGINNKNCLQFKTGDYHSLIEKIELALKLENCDKREIVTNGLKTSQQYQRDFTKQSLLRVIRNICAIND